MVAILATSWNFIGGLTGYPSFAPAAFFGLGAYTTAVLMNAGFNFFITLGIGASFGALVALALGVPILRLKGHYFAIATFGVAEFFRELADNLRITGGGTGSIFPRLRAAGLFHALFLLLHARGGRARGLDTVLRHASPPGLRACRDSGE